MENMSELLDALAHTNDGNKHDTSIDEDIVVVPEASLQPTNKPSTEQGDAKPSAGEKPSSRFSLGSLFYSQLRPSSVASVPTEENNSSTPPVAAAVSTLAVSCPNVSVLAPLKEVSIPPTVSQEEEPSPLLDTPPLSPQAREDNDDEAGTIVPSAESSPRFDMDEDEAAVGSPNLSFQADDVADDVAVDMFWLTGGMSTLPHQEGHEEELCGAQPVVAPMQNAIAMSGITEPTVDGTSNKANAEIPACVDEVEPDNKSEIGFEAFMTIGETLQRQSQDEEEAAVPGVTGRFRCGIKPTRYVLGSVLVSIVLLLTVIVIQMAGKKYSDSPNASVGSIVPGVVEETVSHGQAIIVEAAANTNEQEESWTFFPTASWDRLPSNAEVELNITEEVILGEQHSTPDTTNSMTNATYLWNRLESFLKDYQEPAEEELELNPNGTLTMDSEESSLIGETAEKDDCEADLKNGGIRLKPLLDLFASATSSVRSVEKTSWFSDMRWTACSGLVGSLPSLCKGLLVLVMGLSGGVAGLLYSFSSGKNTPIMTQNTNGQHAAGLIPGLDLSAYDKLRKVHIQALLKSRGCPVAGNKDVLIQRLVEDYCRELDALPYRRLQRRLKKHGLLQNGRREELKLRLINAGMS